MGYDFEAGRLDVSAHPFTTSLGIADIRLTTRYRKDFFNTGFFGSIHEGGHGLYELGIGRELAGTLLAGGTSMGIHESQSCMWENMIGRSLHFWKFYFPNLKDLFPNALSNTEITAFYRAINKVAPSFIRIEADEVKYNLHIILRFNLEKKRIEGQLAVDDLPEAWKRESMDLLGLQPEEDALGVLQDIHWSTMASGEELAANHFVSYLTNKFGEIYEL